MLQSISCGINGLRVCMMEISASLLSANLLCIGEQIRKLENAGIDSLHLDIMDGTFVPNLSFGIELIRQVSLFARVPCIVHLMINEPIKFVDIITDMDIDRLIVHPEDNRHLRSIISITKQKGKKIGIAVNPQTKICDIKGYLNDIDFVLVMGVYPGFGGQELIPETIFKISEIRQICLRKNLRISIDGGINPNTATRAIEQGVDALVVGNYLFENIESFDNQEKEFKRRIDLLMREN